MTLDQAVALSLVPDLPRVGLTDRLRADDPELLEQARAAARRARATLRARAAAARHPRARLERPAISRRAARDLRLRRRRCGIAARSMRCDAPAVAIVGSRAASAVALETAARLAADLAARGITVVSGLARGVDSAAHRGALETGRTIAVLGSGLDRIYPREHAALADEIARAGLVVSEYPPGTPPLPFHFPMRNRLISGLSRAVVVIEASEKSGSLITAACALEQGRDVMAVPGNVLSGRNRGGHALIRDGAKIVECADDIVEELGLGVGRRRRRQSDASKCSRQRLPAIRCCGGWRRDRPTISTRWRRRRASTRRGCCRVCSTSNCAGSSGASAAAVSCAQM